MLPGMRSEAKDKAIDKQAIYAAMAGDNVDAVNSALKAVKNSSTPDNKAFEGALLMKKAGLVGGPGKKLKLFKEGHEKLEEAIKAHPDNVEYHFLRLMIQEHAPKILGYHGEKEEDAKLIKTSYKNLPAPVQQAVKDYSHNSDNLKPTDF